MNKRSSEGEADGPPTKKVKSQRDEASVNISSAQQLQQLLVFSQDNVSQLLKGAHYGRLNPKSTH